MGFLDPFGEGLSVVSGGFARPSRKDRSRSRHRSSHDSSSKKKKRRSRSRSSSDDRKRRHKSSSGGGLFGLDSNYNKHSASKSSFFGLGDNRSRGSFFGGGGDHNRNKGSFFGFSKPSYYKRSSRHGFMHNTWKKLKRLLRDLAHWAKRHPWKVLFLVLMPLITTGILGGLLARFGLRLPQGLERMVGLAGKAMSGDSVGLVGEAVRAASSMSGGSASAKVNVNGAEDRFMAYNSGGGGDWTDGIKGMAKMFI